MVHKTCYLAGPISGLSYEECTGWRDDVTKQLAECGIKALSPLRNKVYLKEMVAIPDQYEVEVMSTSRGIMTRDRFDCMNCSVLFVNLLGTTRVSIGTVMEIAWADANRTPIIMVMEKSGNLHDHAMINESVGFRVSTISDGVNIVKAILADY